MSVFTGGAFFGAMFAGFVGDWLGRKRTIMMGALIFCLGGKRSHNPDGRPEMLTEWFKVVSRPELRVCTISMLDVPLQVSE